jgi:cytochrome c-type biogenesis protein
MQDLLFPAAVFLEGVASFLSPCVLPLIPAYLTYLTGKSAEAMIKDSKAHRVLILNSLAFILGFSLTFIALGAAATTLGKFLIRHQPTIQKISGVMIIFFGLFHTGLIPLRFLNYEKRLQLGTRTPGFATSFLIGFGFGFAWTPCNGPILASVLMMAGSTQSLAAGAALLAVYSLGLGLPFFLIAVGLRIIWKHFKAIYRYMKVIKIVSGILLVIIGVLIYFNRLSLLVGI